MTYQTATIESAPDVADGAWWTVAARAPSKAYRSSVRDRRYPCLSALFGPQLEVYAPVRSASDLEGLVVVERRRQRDARPLGALGVTQECSRCGGDGKPRQTRERSAAVGQTARYEAARRSTHCRVCAGRGYVALDARPQAAAPEAHYTTPEIPDAELARTRARRILSPMTRDVAARWLVPDRGPGYHALWPLTQAGQLLWEAHRAGAPYDPDLARHADRVSRELLSEAEAEARAACAMYGTGPRACK